MLTVEKRCIRQVFGSPKREIVDPRSPFFDVFEYLKKCKESNFRGYLRPHPLVLEKLNKGDCSKCTYNPEENSRCSCCHIIPVRTIVVESEINEMVYAT